MVGQKKQMIRSILEELYSIGMEEGMASASTGLREPYLTSKREAKVDEALNLIEKIVEEKLKPE
ncbi:MAG: hypothetical protein ABSB29_08280 [Nitrososphaerales archaeon]|jgi:20S proteasome alpha/beta subunit